MIKNHNDSFDGDGEFQPRRTRRKIVLSEFYDASLGVGSPMNGLKVAVQRKTRKRQRNQRDNKENKSQENNNGNFSTNSSTNDDSDSNNSVDTTTEVASTICTEDTAKNSVNLNKLVPITNLNGQLVLEAVNNEPGFLEYLHKFMKERKTPIRRVPNLGYKKSMIPFQSLWFY